MSVTSTSQASIAEPRILVQGVNRLERLDDEYQRKLHKTIGTIKDHLESRHRESGLELQLDQELICSKEITQFLDESGARYCFDEDTLFLYPMTTPIHDSLALFADSCLFRLKTEVLTPEERRNFRSAVTSIHLDGRIEGSGSKHQALNKIPDHSFVFRDSQTSCKYHTVIFEAGFSETYHDLVRDMRQWLLHSDGKVQLVILADLNEDKKQLSKHQKTDSFRARAAKLLEDFGSPLGRSKHADILSLMAEEGEQGERATDISSAPAKGLEDKIRRVIREVDWVGDITADLEIWELQGSKPHRRGHARVFPELTGSLPPIYAGDVIPLSCQGSFPNFDASRKLHLDIDDFRLCLRDGISDHAVNRASEFARPKSQDDEDGDYQE